MRVRKPLILQQGQGLVPIYQTNLMYLTIRSTRQPFSLKAFGNIYSRIMNPTNDFLSGGSLPLRRSRSPAVAQGRLQETLALLNITQPGDEIVAGNTSMEAHTSFSL